MRSVVTHKYLVICVTIFTPHAFASGPLHIALPPQSVTSFDDWQATGQDMNSTRLSDLTAARPGR